MNLLRTHRSLVLLGSIVTFLLLSPLLGTAPQWVMLGVALVWAVAIGFSGYWLARSKAWLRTSIALVAIAALMVLIQLIGGRTTALLVTIEQMAVGGVHLLVLGIALRHALTSRQSPAADCVVAGISGYLLIALTFGSLYQILLAHDPMAIQDTMQAVAGTESGPRGPLSSGTVIYFSLVTLTTQGFGDILPISPYARLLAALEGTSGTIYLAVLIASLVSDLRRKRRVSG